MVLAIPPFRNRNLHRLLGFGLLVPTRILPQVLLVRILISTAHMVRAHRQSLTLLSICLVFTLIKRHTPGQFFIDMLAAQSNSSSPTLPTITGSQNLHVLGNGISMPAVYVHAVLLGGSFLFLFPIGVVLLRLTSVRMHLIVQLVTFTLCLIGLIVGVSMSAQSLQFASFAAAHQLMGIVAVIALALQACLGYINHRAYKLTGKSTPLRLLHVGLGRVLLPLGMLSSVL